jgi:hypothetical protein
MRVFADQIGRANGSGEASVALAGNELWDNYLITFDYCL